MYPDQKLEAPVRETEINKVCGDLSYSIDSLYANMATLEERLKGVMQANTPPTAALSAGKDVGPQTELGSRIWELRNRIKDASQRIGAILSRLEV